MYEYACRKYGGWNQVLPNTAVGKKKGVVAVSSLPMCRWVDLFGINEHGDVLWAWDHTTGGPASAYVQTS